MDGSPMKIKITLGTIVQKSSSYCDSSMYWSILGLNTVEIKLNPTIEIIKIRIVRAWSWKNISCSIKGDAAFWNPRAAHVEISKEIFKTYVRILSPLHYSATLEVRN